MKNPTLILLLALCFSVVSVPAQEVTVRTDRKGIINQAQLPPSGVRNYVIEAVTGVDSRIKGKTASATTMAIFNSGGTRNMSAWFADLQPYLTCVCSSSASGWKFTAITARHVVSEAHVGDQSGTTVTFTPADGTAAVTRTLGTRQTVTGDVTGDLVVYPLSADLPASIQPATILPSTLPGGFTWAGVPVACGRQDGRLYVGEISALQGGGSDSFVAASASNRTAWTNAPNPAVTGDSTYPVFLLLGGRPVLLCSIYTGNSTTAAGPDIGVNAAAIRAIIGSGYSLSVAPLPGYPTITNVVAGTTTTLASGSSATASVNLSNGVATLNLGIPQGATGAAGGQGAPGTNGNATGTGTAGTGGAAAPVMINVSSGAGGNAFSTGNGANGQDWGDYAPLDLRWSSGGSSIGSANGGASGEVGDSVFALSGGGGGFGQTGNGGQGGNLNYAVLFCTIGAGGSGSSANVAVGGNGGSPDDYAILISTGGGGSGGGASGTAGGKGGDGGSWGKLKLKGGNGGDGLAYAGGDGGSGGSIIANGGIGGNGNSTTSGGGGNGGGVLDISGGDGSTSGHGGGHGGTLTARGGSATPTANGFPGGTLNLNGGTTLAGGTIDLSNGGNAITIGGVNGKMGMRVAVPSNSSAAGAQGQWSGDDTYFYYYGATGWRRVSGSTF